MTLSWMENNPDNRKVCLCLSRGVSKLMFFCPNVGARKNRTINPTTTFTCQNEQKSPRHFTLTYCPTNTELWTTHVRRSPVLVDVSTIYPPMKAKTCHDKTLTHLLQPIQTPKCVRFTQGTRLDWSRRAVIFHSIYM